MKKNVLEALKDKINENVHNASFVMHDGFISHAREKEDGLRCEVFIDDSGKFNLVVRGGISGLSEEKVYETVAEYFEWYFFFFNLNK